MEALLERSIGYALHQARRPEEARPHFEASLRIAERHKNEEFIIALSRLSDIENKGTVPTIYRLYSLCAIYRLNLSDVLRWYSVDPSGLTADSAAIQLAQTHSEHTEPSTPVSQKVALVL